MNRIDRLLATLLLLQSRRLITADAIAAHFEISLRTVYRDLAALSEGGVAIAAEAGVGYSLVNGYSMPPVMFTPEEAAALFLGGELIDHFTDASLQDAMRSALLKIRAVLPRGHQDRLDRLQGRTALLFPRPASGSNEQAVLSRLQAALAQRRVVEMGYHTRGEPGARTRRVEPLGLIFYSERWHLIAHCRWRQELRDFRTDRIARLTVLDESFTGHEGFSLRAHLESQRERTGQTECLLRVERTAADRLRRIMVGAILQERWVDDWLELRLLAGECDGLARWLLSFGTALQVLSPPSLRERLQSAARQLADHHAHGY